MSTFRRQFSDEKQQEYVEYAVDLDISLSRKFQYEQYSYYDTVVWPKIVSLCSSSDGVLRYCQAMITEMGRVNRKKMDVISSYMVWYYVKIKKQSDTITIPPIEDIASLVSLYMTQIAPQDFDHRIPNICLLLAIMGNWYPQEELEVLFSEQVMSFFINCLHSSPDKMTQLYTLFTLVHSATYENIKGLLFNNFSLRLAVKLKSSTLCHFNPVSLYLNDGDFNCMHFQIGASAQWIMKNVYDADKIIDDEDIPLGRNAHFAADGDEGGEDEVEDEDIEDEEDDNEMEEDNENELVNVRNMPLNLRTSSSMRNIRKVSVDNLFAFGCHYAWQDYQCTRPVDISSGQVFYYEVILLTTASIRLGWATELDDFGFYGFSSDAASISFDAYEKKLCAQGKSQLFADLPTVNPSDVVGCLLDTSRGPSSVYFSFYLNDIEVLHTEWGVEGISLDKGRRRVLYYPTCSLSGCQGVYFNFGQAPYRYSPLLPVYEITSLTSPPPDIIANRMFADKTQKEFEEWMLHFDWRIAEGASDDVFEQLEKKLYQIMLFRGDGALRLTQVIIEKIAVIDENRIEASTRLMEKFLTKDISTVFGAPVEQIQQLLRPYLELQDTCMDPSKEDVPESVIAQSFRYSRNICFYLSIVPSLLKEDITEMNALVEQTVSFLLPLVIKNKHDQVVKLYALRALQSLSKSPLLKERLSTHTLLQKHLQAMAMRADFFAKQTKELPEENNQFQEIDTVTLSKWLLSHLYETDD